MAPFKVGPMAVTQLADVIMASEFTAYHVEFMGDFDNLNRRQAAFLTSTVLRGSHLLQS